MPSWSRDDALNYLLERVDYERMTGIAYREAAYPLERMRSLLSLLDHPEQRFPIVHVAGTKGKGSTAAMIAAMLRAAGFRVGLFSSPHLERIEERFAIDGVICSPETFAQRVDALRPAVQVLDAEVARGGRFELGPTYFELTTALALTHFLAERVDVAVLEVGMGGRLDSTNVCTPAVSVITNISFDHTKQLGSTLAAIAGEKAGIIKPGVPVVSGVEVDEPRDVIRAVAQRQGARLIEQGADFDFEYEPPRHVERQAGWPRITYRSSTGPHERLAEVELNLLGRHQGANAAVALATIGELIRQGWRIDDQALRRGLRGVDWPARIEIVGRRPLVVLDAAHNVASVEALTETLAESFDASRRWLIFATTREKDVTGMLARLLPRFDEAHLTQYANNPRGVPLEELAPLAHAAAEAHAPGVRFSTHADSAAAWAEVIRRAGPEDLICITGSFFIAAELRPLLRSR